MKFSIETTSFFRSTVVTNVYHLSLIHKMCIRDSYSSWRALVSWTIRSALSPSSSDCSSLCSKEPLSQTLDWIKWYTCPFKVDIFNLPGYRNAMTRKFLE